MSVEIRCVITCNGCGATITAPPQLRTTRGLTCYWDAMDIAKKQGWVTLTRYGPASHFCATCADKPLAKQ